MIRAWGVLLTNLKSAHIRHLTAISTDSSTKIYPHYAQNDSKISTVHSITQSTWFSHLPAVLPPVSRLYIQCMYTHAKSTLNKPFSSLNPVCYSLHWWCLHNPKGCQYLSDSSCTSRWRSTDKTLECIHIQRSRMEDGWRWAEEQQWCKPWPGHRTHTPPWK